MHAHMCTYTCARHMHIYSYIYIGIYVCICVRVYTHTRIYNYIDNNVYKWLLMRTLEVSEILIYFSRP
jgi:hypothetical protein